MAELQEALAIEPGEEELIISGAEDIVRSCGSLVKHDTFTDKVEFTHELVRKFIEDHQSEFMVKESAITLICLACINSILRGPLRNKAIALFDYAREFWGEHLRNMENDRSVEVELKIFEIFCNPLQAPAEETPYTPVDLDRYFVQVLAEYGVGFILTRPLPDERIADW